jgi:hypothetical protein
LAAANKKAVGAFAIGIAGLVCLLVLAREVRQEGALGESLNPNYGHPTKAPSGRSHSAPSNFADMSEDQYLEGLRANRPDLTEEQLKEKADHWWKVKTGEAQVSGG